MCENVPLLNKEFKKDLFDIFNEDLNLKTSLDSTKNINRTF